MKKILIIFTTVCLVAAAATIAWIIPKAINTIHSFSGNTLVIDNSATMRSRTVTIGDFHSIEVSSIFDVKVCNDVQPGNMLINAPEELLSHIDYRVEHGVLKIGLKNKRMVRIHSKRLHPTVTLCPTGALRAIIASGAADIKFLTPFEGTDLTMTLSGDSDVEFSGVVTLEGKLTALVSGASDIEFKAPMKAKEVDVVSSGSAEFEAQEVNCNSLNIMSSGSSDVKCKRAEVNTLVIAASGASEVEIKEGVAHVVTYTASGSSEIKINGVKRDTASVQAQN